jgi:hypothetical protein
MQRSTSSLLAPVTSLIVLFLLAAAGVLPAAASGASSPPLAQHEATPLMFIENVGQFGQGVHFRVQGSASSLDLAEDALWFTALDIPAQSQGTDLPRQQPQRGVAIKLSFAGANQHPRLQPFAPLAIPVSYLRGAKPAAWRSAVPVWSGVRYLDLYPGVDLEVTSVDGQLAPRLLADTGADLRQVRLQIDGADDVSIDDKRLRLDTAIGVRTLPLPIAAQGEQPSPVVQFTGARGLEVASAVRSDDAAAASAYSPPLSDLLYSTFLGGSNQEYSTGIAVDRRGSAYVVGYTTSLDMPSTPGAFDTSPAGGMCSSVDLCDDTFVIKLNLSGSGLQYATFLGGSVLDRGNDIVVDERGAAYITGFTNSPDFPVTPDAFDTSFPGTYAGFIVKLNPSGTALTYATFIDYILSDSIAVDERGAAYVAGQTNSPSFPATPGAFDTTINGSYDAVTLKLNRTGSALVYATYVGGAAYDGINDIAVDGHGAAYIVGSTSSADFPTTPGALDTALDGGNDSFVAKLAHNGSTLAYATLLGGQYNEVAKGVAVDRQGHAYVTGFTTSANFPATPGAFDTTYNDPAGDDAMTDTYVAKLNRAGSALVYATFVGGAIDDESTGIAINQRGEAYIAGQTLSPNFPTTPGAFDTSFNTSYGYDAYVTKLNASGSALVYSTFLGGDEDDDSGWGIAVDRHGAAYVIGNTLSTDFPTTVGAYDRSYNGGNADTFVAKLQMVPSE